MKEADKGKQPGGATALSVRTEFGPKERRGLLLLVRLQLPVLPARQPCRWLCLPVYTARKPVQRQSCRLEGGRSIVWPLALSSMRRLKPPRQGTRLPHLASCDKYQLVIVIKTTAKPWGQSRSTSGSRLYST